MNTFAQDVRYGIRTLAKTPAFTITAILSIALGVGANTAIFSVASALLLRSLPYADAERLVILWNRSPGVGITEDWFSTAQYFDIKTGHHGLEQVAIAIGANYNLTGEGEPERVGTIRVSSNLLPMLGARAALGRLFGPQDDLPGTAGTAVLGYGTWMRRFGGSPSAVGRSVFLNGEAYEIIGVLPESFDLPREVMPTLGGAEHAEVLLPLPLAAEAAEVRNREDYNLIGKLRPDVSLPQAQAEMDTITARLRDQHPDIYPPTGGLTFSIVPLQEQVVGHVRRSLVILIASVGFVLLIACANVASLLLSRAVGRQQEIAIRASIGASRGRLVRQLLTESVVLALAGGMLGLVLAGWSLNGIHVLGSKSVPRLDEISIDTGALLFTFIVSLLSGILFGLAPALRLGRADVQTTLKDAARGSAGASAVWARGQNVRRILVTAELALSVVLLIGAGLLIRSFGRLQDVAPGFNPTNVLTLELTMTGRKYNEPASVLETYRLLWQRLQRLPGVTASGGITALPLSQMMAWGPITVDGRTPPPGETFINADQRVVGNDYFQAMEIPLRQGRFFNEHDLTTTQRVLIIDEHMAAQLWPNEDSIGKRVRTGGMDAKADAPWMTIVGVVGRIKQDSLDSESRIAMYHPHGQVPSRALTVVLRTTMDPVELTTSVRREIRELDPDLPLYNLRTMIDRVDESLAHRRFSMLLLTLLAGLALGLAAIGIYGVMAYLVSQGTRELGIRIALGATPGGILVLIVRHGLAVALSGIAIGLVAAFVLTRFMDSLLYGVNAKDPVTFIAIPLLLLVIGLLASYVPARRAIKIDPMISLRSE